MTDTQIIDDVTDLALDYNQNHPPVFPIMTGDGLFPRTVTGALARRLGAAAAGLEGLGPFYLVAAYEPVDDPTDPFGVVPFTSESLAASSAALLSNAIGTPFGVFGPFDQPEAPTPAATLLTVTGTLSDGVWGEIDANLYDTLFWSISAVRKFALPYYTSLYSPEFAAEVEAAFLGAEYAVMAHMPWTEYVMVEGNTVEESGVTDGWNGEGPTTGNGGPPPPAARTAEPLRNAIVAKSGQGRQAIAQHAPERFHVPVFFARGTDGKLHPQAFLPH